MKKTTFYILLFLSACSRNPIDISDQSLEGPIPEYAPLIPYFEEASPFEYIQFDPEKVPVDILISVDNSGSMDPFIQAVEDNIPVFISGLLDLKVNFQMGMVKSTNNEDGSYTSSLFGPHPIVSGTDTEVVSKSKANLQAIRKSFGGGFEQPLVILEQAIENTANQTLFRAGSTHVFMVLSDTDDIGGPATAPYYRDIFGAFSGGKRWGFTAIGNPTGNPCPLAEAPQPIINELASLTGGIVGRICDTNYVEILSNTVKNILALLYEFQLPEIPDKSLGVKIDPESLVIKLDGIEVPPLNASGDGYAYFEDRNVVVFYGTFLPKKNQKVEIHYEYIVP